MDIKPIYDEHMSNDPNQEFLWQSEPASFAREIGFLIDNGYLENVDMDELKKGGNILQKLKPTEAGRLYVALRENVVQQPTKATN